MHHSHTFTKKERLCSKKFTEHLFKKSQTFFAFPFKVVYYLTKSPDSFHPEFPVQVLFSASKRHIKKAADRNLTKRIMREAYRKNKSLLYEKLIESDKKLLLGFIYIGQQPPEYHKTEQKIIFIINRLIQEVGGMNRKT
jgi:ribonuclease P protein component